jgi:hypothetical protein
MFEKSIIVFRDELYFYGGLLAPRRIPKLENHPVSAVRYCFSMYYQSTLHI